MEGKNETAKERAAMCSEENLKLTKKLNELRTTRNHKLAIKEGSEAHLMEMQQVVAYNREMLNKGIIDK